MFLNIDSLIQGQIAEIKYTLEMSKLKEKYGATSNAILKNLSNKVSHLALKKIMDELKKACEMVEEPGYNCLHYLRKSHGLPCACELVHRDMDSEMHDLTSLIHEISMGPICKVREDRRLIKGIISPVFNEDPCQPLTTPLETVVTKGRRKTNSTKNDKSHWEYVSVTYRKTGKSSRLGSGSGSGSSSCSGPSPRGRGRPPRSSMGRGRGRNSVERVTELIRRTNWEEGSVPADYWMDTPDHLYVIANTFNLCVVFLAWLGSTTLLPLVSNMDGNVGTIFIGFIEEQQHFIQALPVSESHWEYSRDSISSGDFGEVPYHVIIRAGTRWNGQNTGLCLRQYVRRCLEPWCLYKSIPQHVHPVVWRPACLLRLDRVGGNTLPIPELSQNTVRHVRLDAIKICNKVMSRGNPASPNLLHPIWYPPNLICCQETYSHSYTPTLKIAGCMACRLQNPV
ncbi:hypothetical protein M9H77_04174 [Catharanthus roseus]|uniref:Uncharacterized protein n=1 Tax=Catharanthus roseus TaxID=4058 RepID=A0ACC0CDT9_CATRO|nr:hypothetical protein M9H77_04174 [Catharanthus roseus]